MAARIDQNDVIELVGQPFLAAQKVDGLAHSPVFGGGHHLGLHEAAGRIFGIGQRLLDGGTVGFVQRRQNRLLLGRLHVLDQVDDIVAVHLAHGLGQHLMGQLLDDLVANGLVDLGQDLAVDLAFIEMQELAPARGRELFDQVGDIGGMDRVQQRVQRRGVIFVDGLGDGFQILLAQPEIILGRVGFGVARLGHGRAPVGRLYQWRQVVRRHHKASAPGPQSPLRRASASACNSGEPAARIVPPSCAGPPCQSVTTPPAALITAMGAATS